jgi:hypothetical protein
MRRPTTWLLAALLLATAAAARAAVPTPTIEGPISSPGSAFVQATSFDLGSVGYEQHEYFISGTATAYANVGALTDDGKWTVAPAATAPYKTRIVVNRPSNPKRFNGTVIVEWLNVSSGFDAAPDWLLGHTELIREGYAWVGVSAQKVGIEGGTGLINLPFGLKQINPARYGSLVHPGDSFSYDMFSQAGQAARQTSGVAPLGGLVPKRVIAAGESQSAFRMVTYVDAIHPLTHVFDGFLIHSRGFGSAALSEAPQAAIATPGAVPIRADVDVPVLTFETESDLTFLGFVGARQPDARKIRTWEVAGTSHADYYVVWQGMSDTGQSPAIVQPVATASPIPGIVECGQPINDGPQHFVVNAAFAALNRWVRRGTPPRSAPRLDVAAGPPPAIQVDANGVAEGGIRTPQVDAPIARFTGVQPGSLLCGLLGTTTPFDDATLHALYPTPKSFRARFKRSLRRAVRAGWVRPADASLMKAWRATAAVGG